ncbi:MAG: DUF3575 domain-containing protein [Saprospiraceae bacterium]|nr:DUF3575 domain-containing protein [Saprospiraceae bacterium]
MLKGGAGLIITEGGGGFVIDGGFEIKLNSRLGLQFSIANSDFSFESQSHKKFIVTPQLRYYLKKDLWEKSPYFGAILQYHKGETGDEIYSSSSSAFGWQSSNYKKTGLGLMFGKHIKIYKRLGLDLHLGGIFERGNIHVKNEYWSSTPNRPANSYYTEKNKNSVRPFWTVNLYLALGELTKSEKIIKNTEGAY